MWLSHLYLMSQNLMSHLHLIRQNLHLGHRHWIRHIRHPQQFVYQKLMDCLDYH
jgi:hypothetical protein